MCDMTFSHQRYDIYAFVCVCVCIYVYTHILWKSVRIVQFCWPCNFCLWHDSFICDSYAWHDPFISNSYVWYDALICVTCLIHMCGVTCVDTCLKCLCCSVVQCGAVCCSVLQRVAACCSVLQCVAVVCDMPGVYTCVECLSEAMALSWILRIWLQCVAVCCSVLQCVAVCCSVLQCVAVRCCVLQCAAVCCGASLGVLQSAVVTEAKTMSFVVRRFLICMSHVTHMNESCHTYK